MLETMFLPKKCEERAGGDMNCPFKYTFARNPADSPSASSLLLWILPLQLVWNLDVHIMT